jgi:GTP cyclohydrolase I
MLNQQKTDPILGRYIESELKKQGIETPILKNNYSDSRKLAMIENSFKNIMNALELDLDNDSLIETPKRIAKMFVQEFFWGLNYENFPKITTIENKMEYDEMVIEKNIKAMSVCEHHFVTIDAKCHIAYIPNKKVLGLSKLNRVVEFFSRRPQVQERLTEQIYYALQAILETDNIAVIIDGVHYCVKSRGIEDVNSSTITSKMGGSFKTEMNLRQEFLNLVK